MINACVVGLGKRGQSLIRDVLLKNKDVNVRKQAYENYFSEYKKYQNLFMNLLKKMVQND